MIVSCYLLFRRDELPSNVPSNDDPTKFHHCSGSARCFTTLTATPVAGMSYPFPSHSSSKRHGPFGHTMRVAFLDGRTFPFTKISTQALPDIAHNPLARTETLSDILRALKNPEYRLIRAWQYVSQLQHRIETLLDIRRALKNPRHRLSRASPELCLVRTRLARIFHGSELNRYFSITTCQDSRGEFDVLDSYSATGKAIQGFFVSCFVASRA